MLHFICSCSGEDDLLSSAQIAGDAPNLTRLYSSVLLQMLSRPGIPWMTGVGSRETYLVFRLSLSDVLHKEFPLCDMAGLARARQCRLLQWNKGGYLYGPTGVLSFWLRSFATTEVKEMHAHYTASS